jgi:CDP-diacylglycerol--glycerol-3-phosphate 3-phosphatidyltransferase
VIDPKNFYSAFRQAFQPVVRWLARAGLTPNTVTAVGMALNLAATPFIALGHFWWAAGIFVLASICDMLDGSLARYSGTASAFGAFLDSTTDRLSEGVTLIALGVYYSRTERLPELVAVFIFLIASYLVSYERARAEALGIECKLGLMARPERIVVLVTGFVLSRWYVLTIAVYALAVLTSWTVVQRVLHVRRQLRDKGETQAP